MTDHNRTLVITGMAPGNFLVKSLLTNFNLDEHHTILWLLSSFETEFKSQGASAILSIKRDEVQQRLAQLKAWVSEGHNLIIVLTGITSTPVVERGNVIGNFRLTDLWFLSGVTATSLAGERVEYIGPQNPELQTYAQALRYEYVLQSNKDDDVPIFRVGRSAGGADQIVGLSRRFGKGRLFLVPPARIGDANANTKFLATLPDQIKVDRQAVDLPDWVNQYQSPAEVSAIESIAAREVAMRKLQVDIDADNATLSETRWLKHLMAGSGDVFVDAVARALNSLGLRTTDGPHPRGDLLILDGRKIAAAEIKGLDGVAKEANLRQTQRWVADVNSTLVATLEDRNADPHLAMYGEKLAELGIDLGAAHTEGSKGVMIIGTFRKMPIGDRCEKDFPDDMLRIAERDSVCCLTGLDLLVWYLASQADENLKGEFREKLFSTAGRLEAPMQWQSVLKAKS